MSDCWPYARAAYAAGLAATGPAGLVLPGRAAAGLHAAAELAEGLPAGLLVERILDLGRLEGLWQTIYARREALLERWLDAMRRLWRRITGDMPNGRIASTSAEAAALIVREELREQPGRGQRVELLHDATAEATAEGGAAAHQQVRETRAEMLDDWDIAFADAYEQLGRLEEHWETARLLDDQLTGSVARRVGRLMQAVAEQGLTRDQVIVRLLATWEDMADPANYVDLATTTALSQGAIAVYESEGITHYDFMTAGDARVDLPCVAAGDGSPYPVGGGPVPPLHFSCRCNVAPSLEGR